MTRDKEDILELKIPVLPGVLDINIREFLRWFKKKPNEKEDDVLIVPKRVLQIFENHNVAVTQIPRLIPKLSLEQVSNPETLLSALTIEVLQEISDLFQIQRKWLEGTTDIIYNCHYYCYKNPWKFFKDLETLKIGIFDRPMVAFSSVSKFDNNSNKDQPILLVQREKSADLDDKPVYRYRIIDQFLWGYFKTRIQLKAMMHIWYKKYEIPVNIYHVDKKILEGMEAGKIVPDSYIRNSKQLRNIGLEDFSLSFEEDRLAKETEELDEVMEYIKAYKLVKMDGEDPKTSFDTAKYR